MFLRKMQPTKPTWITKLRYVQVKQGPCEAPVLMANFKRHCGNGKSNLCKHSRWECCRRSSCSIPPICRLLQWYPHAALLSISVFFIDRQPNRVSTGNKKKSLWSECHKSFFGGMVEHWVLSCAHIRTASTASKVQL